MNKDTAKSRTTRKRRSAAEARDLILDAAELRLREVGPEGLKLQEIARDIGVSHPAILHHFESRQGLVRAVVERALDGLRSSILPMVREHLDSGEEFDVPKLMSKIYETLSKRGHARLMAWLILTGKDLDDPGLYLRSMAEAGQVRLIQESGGRNLDFDNILFAVMLIGYASLGAGIAGPLMHLSAGLSDDDDAVERFNHWFANVIEGILMPRANGPQKLPP